MEHVKSCVCFIFFCIGLLRVGSPVAFLSDNVLVLVVQVFSLVCCFLVCPGLFLGVNQCLGIGWVCELVAFWFAICPCAGSCLCCCPLLLCAFCTVHTFLLGWGSILRHVWRVGSPLFEMNHLRWISWHVWWPLHSPPTRGACHSSQTQKKLPDTF